MSSFVLVPGAGGESWYWHRVVPLLRDAGHEAIAVDLPAADDDAALAEYADAIVEAVGKAGVGGPHVVVAQSLGAFSAPLAAARLDAEQLILVAPMIPAPGEVFG